MILLGSTGRMLKRTPLFFRRTFFLLLVSTLSLRAVSVPKGMVLVPGGSFEMGGDPGLMGGGSQSHNTSYPVHEVTVDAFLLDEAEVTNAQFAEFVKATGYVSFAERPLPKAYVAEMERAAAEQIQELTTLAKQATGRQLEGILDAIDRIKEAAIFGDSAGAIVFAPPEDEVYNENDYTQWWRIIPGASWRAPEGPGSTWVDPGRP